MFNTKEKISKNLLYILKDLGVTVEKVTVQEPVDFSHGDLTSNIALQISKDLQLPPREIAQKIADMYPEDEDIEKVEVAGAGFLNFTFSEQYLRKVVSTISKEGSEAFRIGLNKGKKYIIEYTDPNPFKIFHIGHLYTNIVGESFARQQEALGATVYRANYQGDVGLHVAKTLYGLKILFEKESTTFEDLKKRDLVEKVKYLGEAYMLGFNHYDDLKDREAIEEVKMLNYYIFSLYIPSLERKPFFDTFEKEGIKEMYEDGKQWCMEHFERIYERTGTKFDNYFLESEMSEKGLELVMENTTPEGKAIFIKDDGAVIYRGDESKGLHTRVFVNNEGLPTYEAKELALAYTKFEQVPFDESVIITANEQSMYFKVVLDAISQLSPEIANRSKHFSHGMVKLPGAEKMSSRKGQIIEGEWLLDETKRRVVDIMEGSKQWDESEISQASEKISIAAIKYSFLKVGVGKDVIFDFEKSISFDGDTGPYLLYVYARCKSILDGQRINDTQDGRYPLNPYTKALISQISRYNDTLLNSSLSYTPSTLCSYLFDLGQSFNSFYQNVRVLESEDKEFLLTVVDATAKTMEHGLNVLGIKVVDRM
ncbi:MAG: arginine--tRNA ligase [Candidatus Dojkabacteria bacterium]|jgi:arginyl-tRNA synthetase|nr:arginine--tRNA ligase [Candidatus Dojkabacteria bacterium]